MIIDQSDDFGAPGGGYRHQSSYAMGQHGYGGPLGGGNYHSSVSSTHMGGGATPFGYSGGRSHTMSSAGGHGGFGHHGMHGSSAQYSQNYNYQNGPHGSAQTAFSSSSMGGATPFGHYQNDYTAFKGV